MNILDTLDQRLLSIEELLSQLLTKVNPDPVIKDDWVESKEAASLLHIGIDRFYSTHKRFLSSSKPGGRLLFSRKEIQEYITSKSKRPVI